MSATSPDGGGRPVLMDYTETITAVRDRLYKLEARERSRDRLVKRLVVAVVAMLAVLLTAVVLVGLMYLQRDDARSFYNKAIRDGRLRIHQLVCLVPPGSDFARELRHRYGCPPPGAPGHRQRVTK